MTKIAVIFGGPSPEHEISVLTGLQAGRILFDAGKDVICIYWTKQGNWIQVDPKLEAQEFLKTDIPNSTRLELVIPEEFIERKKLKSKKTETLFTGSPSGNDQANFVVNYPNNFNTVGRFIGANENKLLNLDSKNTKDFAWAISYGLGYVYTDYFYVNDFDKSYELEKIKDTTMQVVSLDTYFDSFVITFTLKSSKFAVTNENSTKENWGGVNIAIYFR